MAGIVIVLLIVFAVIGKLQSGGGSFDVDGDHSDNGGGGFGGFGSFGDGGGDGGGG